MNVSAMSHADLYCVTLVSGLGQCWQYAASPYNSDVQMREYVLDQAWRMKGLA